MTIQRAANGNGLLIVMFSLRIIWTSPLAAFDKHCAIPGHVRANVR